MANFQSNVKKREDVTISEEYLLYVTNIPMELDKTGIQQIFKPYGTITSILNPPNTQWAFITYKTFREAEYAIRDLDNKPPLCLKVSLSTKKKSVDENQKKVFNQNFQTIDQNPTFDHQPHETANIETGELPNYSNILLNYNHQRKVPINSHRVSDDFSYPEPINDYLFDPYESAESLDYKNTLWTRDRVTVTRDGKRHVSLGRGYSLYETPEPHSSIKTPVTTISEKRSNGLYEYGQDSLKQKLESCVYCKKITAVKCGKCYSFYCSKECQVTDWPHHRNECPQIHMIDVKSASSNENQINVTNLNPVQKQLRRPREKSLFNTNLVSINNECKEDIKSETLMKPSEDNCQINITNKNDKTKDDEYKLDVTEKEKEIPNENANITSFDITKDEKNIVFPRNASNTNNKYIENKKPGFFKKPNENYVQTDSINNTDDKMENKECKLGITKIVVPNKYTNRNDCKIKSQQKLFQNNAFLSTVNFVKVKILEFTQGKDFWVRRMDQEIIYEKMMHDLQNTVKKMSVMNLIIGNIYGCKYDNIWHRAKIISFNPTSIFFIDLGVTTTVKVNDFRDINNLKNMIPFAIKICLQKSSSVKNENLKKNQIIDVKAIHFIENVIFVEMMNENNKKILNESSKPKLQLNFKSHTNSTNNNDDICATTSNFTLNTNKKTNEGENKKNIIVSSNGKNICENKNENKSNNETIPRRLSNVINSISIGGCGFLKVNTELNKNIYGITLRPNNLIDEFYQIISKLSNTCTSMKLNYEYKPNIGDFVCGQGEINDDWYRGYIVTLNPQIQLAMIDKTDTIPVQKIVPCPDEFFNICTFGAICEINANDIKLVMKNHYEYKVINNVNEISIEIQLDERNKIKGILKPWEPKPKQNSIQYLKLKNESKVCISSYLNHYVMFVRSLEPEDLEEFNKLMQKIAKCAQTAAYLQEPPVAGEVVLSQYLDSNFYRASVTHIQEEEATVTYVDYGNSERTLWKKLKILPADLKTHQSCSTKILLKDIPTDVTMTEKVSQYLNDFVSKYEPLKCNFNGLPYEDGVQLITANGESVNDKIKQLLIPNWKIEEDKTVYTLDDIDVVPLGNIGDTVNVVIMNVIKEASEYFMCLLDYELILHVHEILPKLYYIPRANELCLALYKDNWYRALCLSKSESADKVAIFYIDYGNCEEVLHHNIRPMTRDFLKPNSLANMCNLVNLLPEDKDGSYSPEVLKRISELVKINEIYIAKIIDCDNGNYKVELPEVRRQLIEEKLIPSS
ncbi:hypothetical protein M0802_000254 [Mischocyttarus mexicanus]|nr:hypothetical protein M0802_000254 [Mischocyttarus mexicanus]